MENLLHRGQGGVGKIYAVEVGKQIRFSISGDLPAASAKRDSIQHPFLDPLAAWANSVRLFEFGKGLGHNTLAIAIKSDVDVTKPHDTTQIVQVFNKGRVTYQDLFVNSIKDDMRLLGYYIDDIDLRRPSNMLVLQQIALEGELRGISVKEHDLQGWTDHPSISQGMFRALSLVIQFNYHVCTKASATILIDDVGEGLDYERSRALVKLLREKAMASGIQLIMSTNDRFVMNGIPLEDWCLLERTGHEVRAYNYANAAEAFERFKKTGLSNFDLLTSDYVSKYLQRVSQHGENGNIRRGSDGENIHREADKGNGGEPSVPH